MLFSASATPTCEGEALRETRWRPASLCAWITGPAPTFDIRHRARVVKHLACLLVAHGRLPVANWLRGVRCRA
jgi:hypothetical protein